MNSRFLIIILVMGIVGMAAMGMITKFAFESNKELQKVARFKQELLDQFGEQGISEVSYRRLPKRQGAVLRMVGDPSKIGEAETLHREIAEYYAKNFWGSGPQLKLVYVPPKRFGCGGSRAFVEKEFAMSVVRREIRAAESRLRLEKALRQQQGLRLYDIEEQRQKLSVKVARDPKESFGTDPRALLRDLARTVVRQYRPPRNVKIHLQLLEILPRTESGPADPAASGASLIKIVAEGSFDFRGQPIRR